LLSIIKESMPDKTIYNFMQSLKILKPNEEFFEGMNLKDRVKDFEVYYKKKCKFVLNSRLSRRR
jgi:hypothetical protein